MSLTSCAASANGGVENCKFSKFAASQFVLPTMCCTRFAVLHILRCLTLRIHTVCIVEVCSFSQFGTFRCATSRSLRCRDLQIRKVYGVEVCRFRSVCDVEICSDAQFVHCVLRYHLVALLGCAGSTICGSGFAASMIVVSADCGI